MIGVGLTDEEKREAIARALGLELIGADARGNSTGNLLVRKKGKTDWVVQGDWLSDLNAALFLCYRLKHRFDIIIRMHNASRWCVTFCEPSHEVQASNESLSRAICDAFLASLPVHQPQPEKI